MSSGSCLVYRGLCKTTFVFTEMFVAYMRRLPLLNIEGVHTLLSLWGKAPVIKAFGSWTYQFPMMLF